MSTAARHKAEPAIQSIDVTDSAIIAKFRDGRTITVPISWSYRLELATPAQRRNYEIFGGGEYVHWPDIDEDLSANGFLNGSPAPRLKAYRDYVRKLRAARRPTAHTKAGVIRS